MSESKNRGRVLAAPRTGTSSWRAAAGLPIRGVHSAWRRAPVSLRLPVLTLWRALRWYSADQAGTFAAAIAYYALFSLLPLAFITLALLGLLIPEERVVEFVFDQVPLQETPEVEADVRRLVSRARSMSPAGLGVGAVLLVWSASGVFAAVRRGLNATSHRTKTRPYWHEKLIDFALVPSLAVLIGISLGLTAIAQFFVDWAADAGPGFLASPWTWRLLSAAIAAAVSFAMFALLYRYVPSSRPDWPEALAGAACATLLFEAVKNLAAAVLRMTAVGQDPSLYAGFGTAMVFLSWMMLNASILLFGAEFGRALASVARELRQPPRD